MNRKSLKNILSFTGFLLLFFFMQSCKKSDKGCAYSAPTQVAPVAEINYLQSYITTNNITAQQHSSGIFYHIDSTGAGATPNICSIVRVNYEGFLLNGSRFDFNTTAAGASFALGELIKGWQYAIPLIKTGGSITVYIPPSLGYGSRNVLDNNGSVLIPANSYLRFVITLRDVQ